MTASVGKSLLPLIDSPGIPGNPQGATFRSPSPRGQEFPGELKTLAVMIFFIHWRTGEMGFSQRNKMSL